MSRKALLDDPPPDTEDRFNRLLQEMAKPAKQVEQIPSEEEAVRLSR